MNLAERRTVEEFQKEEFPRLESELKEAAGTPVQVEVDWESLAVPGESHLYRECWRQIYFEPAIAGLKHVTRDDMGKTAVKDGIEKIVITHKKGCVYGDCWATLEGKTLTLDHDPVSNPQDVEDRKAGLIKLLESSL